MSNEFVLDINDANQPYWEALTQGDLLYQSCDSCGHRWLPPSRSCPSCLSVSLSWKTSSGKGKIVSWVVYHIAYHPSFKDRLPYNVTIIELQEGPRLMSNVLGDNSMLAPNAAVSLIVEKEGETHVPRFKFD
jgi:uncharacterized OB-fold protein